MGVMFKQLFVLIVIFSLNAPHIKANVIEDSSAVDNTETGIIPGQYTFITPVKKPSFSINSLFTNEIRFKSNLNRLSFLGHGKYLDSYAPLPQMFIDINLYPEESKNKMLLLALGGSVAGQVLKYGRLELAKRNLGFIVPNLSGLYFYYGYAKFRTNFFCRLTNTDKIINVNICGEKITYNYYDRMYAKQKTFALQPMRGWQFFYLQTIYPTEEYHEFGVSGYYRKLNLYINYIKNFTLPERNRLAIVSFVTL